MCLLFIIRFGYNADFEDMSCEMIYGQVPPPFEEDPVSKQPCYANICKFLWEESLAERLSVKRIITEWLYEILTHLYLRRHHCESQLKCLSKTQRELGGDQFGWLCNHFNIQSIRSRIYICYTLCNFCNHTFVYKVQYQKIEIYDTNFTFFYIYKKKRIFYIINGWKIVLASYIQRSDLNITAFLHWYFR